MITCNDSPFIIMLIYNFYCPLPLYPGKSGILYPEAWRVTVTSPTHLPWPQVHFTASLRGVLTPSVFPFHHRPTPLWSLPTMPGSLLREQSAHATVLTLLTALWAHSTLTLTLPVFGIISKWSFLLSECTRKWHLPKMYLYQKYNHFNSNFCQMQYVLLHPQSMLNVGHLFL